MGYIDTLLRSPLGAPQWLPGLAGVAAHVCVRVRMCKSEERWLSDGEDEEDEMRRSKQCKLCGCRNAA